MPVCIHVLRERQDRYTVFVCGSSFNSITHYLTRIQTYIRRYGGHALYKDPYKRQTVKPEVVWNIHKGLDLDKEEVEKVRVMVRVFVCMLSSS